jgi:hypothetical protein
VNAEVSPLVVAQHLYVERAHFRYPLRHGSCAGSSHVPAQSWGPGGRAHGGCADPLPLVPGAWELAGDRVSVRTKSPLSVHGAHDVEVAFVPDPANMWSCAGHRPDQATQLMTAVPRPSVINVRLVGRPCRWVNGSLVRFDGIVRPGVLV